MKKYTTIAFCALVFAACGESITLVDNDNGSDSDSLGTTYIKSQENVIMPWTRVFDDREVETMIIDVDQLTLTKQSAEGIERGDILVSANPDAPFLRKVVSIETDGDEVVVNTRQALMTEAVYKGTLSDSPQERSTETGSRTQTQELSSSVAEKKGFGRGVVEGLSKSSGSQNPKVDFSVSPKLNTDVSGYFDLKVAPGQNIKAARFPSSLSCSTSDDCYPNAARGGDREVSCEQNRCVFRDEPTSCNDIIAALDYAEKNPVCKLMFKEYYAGKFSLDQFDNSVCDEPDLHAGVGDTIHYPPHPAQVDWAKDRCVGTLQRLVVDLEGSVTPTTGPIGIQVTAEEKGKISWSGDKRLGTRTFFIGWLPVVLTVNGTLTLEASYEAKLKAVSVALDPIEVDGLKFGTGFNYFASEGADDGKGVMVNGTFQSFSQGDYGKMKLNPTRTPNAQVKGLELKRQNLTFESAGSLTFKLSAQPRIDVLLYDVAGPFLEPFSPYGELVFDASGKFEDGELTAGGDRCGDAPADLCARAGVEGHVGISAVKLFGNKAEWKTELYNSCSDFCESNPETLCTKWCLFEDTEPTEPEPQVNILVVWDDEDFDLDLTLKAPDLVTYSGTGTDSRHGYRHSGDTCPAAFAGCRDERDPKRRKFVESVFVRHDYEGRMADDRTRHEIEIATFQGAQVSGSFDIIIEKDGEVIGEYRHNEVPAVGQATTFEFALH